ncbi:hypothetical protein FPSE5266_20134 [Fusarium pseudograminearum]|nr:hypothetical protein FPSE5266_20134 [Fusarium pseudograminearum]
MLTRPQFWKDNYDQIIRAAKRISMRKLATCPITSVALAEKWLMEDADKLRTKFFKVIQTVLNTMKKEPDSADAELKHKLGKDEFTEDEGDDDDGGDDGGYDGEDDADNESTALEPEPSPRVDA